MARAFVIKSVSSDVPSYVIPGVFDSLRNGKARIGWSYRNDLDLRTLRERVRVEEWSHLSSEEQDAWACHRFLDDVSIGDYLVYPHQPEYGKFSIAVVAGEYGYLSGEESIEGDFRSFRPCKLLTLQPIDRYDEIVPPRIRTKLGLQGRFYELYDIELLKSVLERIDHSGKIDAGTAAPRIKRVFDSISQKVSELIQGEFPRHDFSRIFLKELFEAMGYSVLLQEGPTEHGADLVVTIGDDLLPRQFTVGVQAFSYEGEISPNALQAKLNQLHEGRARNHLDFGVLITTGSCPGGKKLIEENNKDNPQQQVRLIDGEQLASLFIQHFDIRSETQ
jgi:hypothetical protein